MANTTTKSSKSNSVKRAAPVKAEEELVKAPRVAKTDDELKRCDSFDEAQIAVSGTYRRFKPKTNNGWTKVLWSWELLPSTEDRVDKVSNSIHMELTWNRIGKWSAYFVCEHENAKGVMHAGPGAHGCETHKEAISRAVESFMCSMTRWTSVMLRINVAKAQKDAVVKK
jgi:hypothetical protein